MLIMFRSDPLRCVDCCVHLYLLFFLKKTELSSELLRVHSVLIMQSNFDDYVLP